MKIVISFLVIAFVMTAFVGMAVANEMSGEVIAVDAAKGTLTLKSGTVDVPFDCETGSIIKDVKVGDHVTVKYKEEGGKKTATEVTEKEMKPAGGY